MGGVLYRPSVASSGEPVSSYKANCSLRTVLDSSNYSSYALPKYGGGLVEGVITCWRVEPHLDNNDRCGTATNRWQAVHAVEGYYDGEVYIRQGKNLNLRASSGSTDTGDIVFWDGAGSELQRIWTMYGELRCRDLNGYNARIIWTENQVNFAAGSGTVSSSWTSVSFSKTFASPPKVVACYAADFTGDSGSIKVRNITTTGFQWVIGGSFSSRTANWIAVLA